MITLSYSQSGYPKQIVQGKDTLTLITSNQVKFLNKENAKNKQFQSMLKNDSIEKLQAEKTIFDCEKAKRALENTNSILEGEKKNRQQLLDQKDVNITDLMNVIKKSNTKIGILGGLLITVTTLLILKTI